MNDVHYLWLDLETTGLNPWFDVILECGWFLTDQKLNPTTQGTSRLMGFPHALSLCTPEVAEMHKRSGLALDIKRKLTSLAEDVEEQILDDLPPATTVQLAGSGVHFDQKFLEVGMPTLIDRLHYRLLDVSSIERFVRDVVGFDIPKTDPVHRALPDAEHAWKRACDLRDLISGGTS
jgi:oligoribonuclease